MNINRTPFIHHLLGKCPDLAPLDISALRVLFHSCQASTSCMDPERSFLEVLLILKSNGWGGGGGGRGPA